MAITIIEYVLFKNLYEAGAFRANPSLLELGEANWYGDVPLQRLVDDINALMPGDKAGVLVEELRSILRNQGQWASWDVSKIFYRLFVNYRSANSIDLHGPPHAWKMDLNQPLDLGGQQFDLVLNLGTAEHVFNVYQVFKSVHELTLPGGMMIHGLPFNGWHDHGFYCFQPTFFFDLAQANGYSIGILAYAELNPFRMVQIRDREDVGRMAKDEQIGKNALLYCVYRKPAAESPFNVPMQGVYFARTSQAVVDNWRNLR